jgi:hypothetical protein
VTGAKIQRKFSYQKKIVTFFLQLDFICMFQIWTHNISIMPQFWTERNEQFTYRLTSRALSARRSSSRMLLRAKAGIPAIGPRHTSKWQQAVLWTPSFGLNGYFGDFRGTQLQAERSRGSIPDELMGIFH